MIADPLVPYAALASVASITTAVEAALAIQLVGTTNELARRHDAAGVGTPQNKVKEEARWARRLLAPLGAAVAGLNGATIGCWAWEVASHTPSPAAIFVVPLAAVCVLWLAILPLGVSVWRRLGRYA